jgi:GDP-L-fucose synthase
MELKNGLLLGATGLAGSGISKQLNKLGIKFDHPTRDELDLLNQTMVSNYFLSKKPEFTVIAAGVVGGIHQNINRQAHFLVNNFEISKNVLMAAFEARVPNLVMITSSCIYPVGASMPLKEADFYHGAPEPTNSGHAIGKKAACTLLQHLKEGTDLNWTSLISSSLYGAEDDFTGNGHVIPGLINRFLTAVENNADIEPIWGQPTTAREFLFNEDLGSAVISILNLESRPTLINVGSGETVTMLKLAEEIAQIVKYKGKISFDTSRPSGWPIREVDSSFIKESGWNPSVLLNAGLRLVLSSKI